MKNISSYSKLLKEAASNFGAQCTARAMGTAINQLNQKREIAIEDFVNIASENIMIKDLDGLREYSDFFITSSA
jgi:hypothetical protein